MRPIFKATMNCDCTDPMDNSSGKCLYTVSLYPDMTYVVRWCGQIVDDGTVYSPRYGPRDISRLFERKLEEIIKTHIAKQRSEL